MTKNFLEDTPIATKIKFGSKWHPCHVTRVSYQDRNYERHILVDVILLDCDEKNTFQEMPMELLHWKVYQRVVHAAFRQECIDLVEQQKVVRYDVQSTQRG
jgi:hypothetical protein